MSFKGIFKALTATEGKMGAFNKIRKGVGDAIVTASGGQAMTRPQAPAPIKEEEPPPPTFTDPVLAGRDPMSKPKMIDPGLPPPLIDPAQLGGDDIDPRKRRIQQMMMG